MSGSSREIITLQFGNYANFAGAHFWNFQDECIGNHGHGLGEADGDDDSSGGGGGPEIDHPALYRGGQTEHGDQTLTPRVLLFDARSSLGPLRSGGYLYNQQSGEAAAAEAEALKAAWGGRLQTFEAEAEPKNAFLSFLDGEGPMADAFAAVGGQDPALSLGGPGGGAAKPPAPPSGAAYSGNAAATSSQARRRGGRGADYDSEDEDYGEEEEEEEEGHYGGAMGGANKGEEEEKRRQAAEAALEAPLDAGEEREARAAADMDFGLDGDGARGAADVVRYWSDFLKVHLHPRSIQTLPFDSSGDDAFNMHGAGSWGNSGGGGGGAAAAGISAEQAEAAYDGFRYFLEECDNMQGTQCFVTNTDGWGGFARDMIVQIADECPNKPRLIFGLQDAGLDGGKGGAPAGAGDDGEAGDGGQAAAEGGGAAGGAGAAATALSGSTAPGSMAATAETQMARGKRLRRRAVNEALSLAGLSELATTYVPLSAAHWGVGSFVAAGLDTRGAKGSRYFFPHVRANSRLAYHSSAVLGAAIDTATLPFRMAPVAQRQRMAQWAHGLAPRSGMPVALLSAALPFELAAPTTATGAMNAGAPGEMRGAGAHGGGMANGQDLRMASTGDVAHAAGCALERKLRAATPLHEQQRALSFAEQVGGAARRQQRKAPDVHAQSIVIRGLPEALKEHAGHAAGRRRGMAVARFVQRSPHAPPSAMSICAPRTALPVPLCFPRFFSPRLTRDGRLLPANVDPSPEARAAAAAADKRGCGGVSHCAAATELACTSAAGAPIRRVAGAFGSRVAMVEFEQAGAARDDLEEARVALVEMAAEYHEERSDDEDSDDAGGVGTSGALRTYG